MYRRHCINLRCNVLPLATEDGPLRRAAPAPSVAFTNGQPKTLNLAAHGCNAGLGSFCRALSLASQPA